MTNTTTNLGLITYNTLLDSGSLVANYINDVSGSEITQNLGKLDFFAGTVSSSLVGLSASIVSINSQLVAALPAQVTAGSSNTALVSASGLAHSDYGKRTCVIPLNTSASLTTANINYIRIPSVMNGWILVDAQASCSGSSKSGSPIFMVSKSSASAVSFTDMLSSGIRIDEGEYDSSTAGAIRIISNSASSVFTGNKVKVSATTSGSSVTYAQVTLTFQKLP